MDDLKAHIERLRVRYQAEPTMPPADVLGICEDLRLRLEDQAAVWDAWAKLDHRIAQLEKTAPSYKDPHAG